MAGERQWLRYCRLTVTQEGENPMEIDLSGLRVRFHVSQATAARPCTAEISVYNVSDAVVNAIQNPTRNFLKRSFVSVTLEAGYQENHAVVFKGDLWWKSVGVESETDTFLRLIAATGDRAHQNAFTSASIPKGASPKDVVKTVTDTMDPYGVKLVVAPEYPETKLLRGKTIYKMSRDALQDAADANGFTWAYTDRGIVAIAKDGAIKEYDRVIVLDASSGLLERPEITVDGLKLRALLNPELEWGRLVQIKSSIQRPDYSTEVSASAVETNRTANGGTLDADGIYIIKSREFVGDTRSNDWYVDLLCIAYNTEAAPISQTPYTTIPNVK